MAYFYIRYGFKIEFSLERITCISETVLLLNMIKHNQQNLEKIAL